MKKLTLFASVVFLFSISSVFAGSMNGKIKFVSSETSDGYFMIDVIASTDLGPSTTTTDVFFKFYRTGAAGSTTGKTLSDASFKQAYAAALAAVSGGLNVTVISSWDAIPAAFGSCMGSCVQTFCAGYQP